MAAALSSAVSASPRSQRRGHTLPLRSNSACCCSCLDAGKSRFPSQKCRLPMRRPRILGRPGSVFSRGLSEAPPRTTNYEFSDGVAEVELRLDLVATNVQSSRDIVVDVDESSLRVRTQNSGSLVIIFETSHLYEKIKPSETIWFIDEEQLVINLKKYDTNLQWPDIMETWESLTRGLVQLLKGTSIYIVGESTEINEKVAGALAAGLGYTPFSTGELLETYAQQSLDACLRSAMTPATVIPGVFYDPLVVQDYMQLGYLTTPMTFGHFAPVVQSLYFLGVIPAPTVEAAANTYAANNSKET